MLFTHSQILIREYILNTLPKNIDGKITLDISQKFNTIVLSSIQEREDIVFIQSDNGQIDNKNVVAYLRRNGVYIRYTHPYHPNMNNFVERSI